MAAKLVRNGWERRRRDVALQGASKTIKGIQSIYVKDMQAIVENERIVEYRITAKISFVLDEHR